MVIKFVLEKAALIVPTSQTMSTLALLLGSGITSIPLVSMLYEKYARQKSWKYILTDVRWERVALISSIGLSFVVPAVLYKTGTQLSFKPKA